VISSTPSLFQTSQIQTKILHYTRHNPQLQPKRQLYTILNMSDSTNSTLGSYVSSATGAAQSALGNLTGNTADQSRGESKKTEAQAEYDASHATARAGGITVSGSGAAATDDPNRTEGSYNQTMGSAKSAVGGLFGADGLKQEGDRQNAEGKGQEAQGQLTDLGSGIKDRVGGTLGGAAAGLTGNREKMTEFQDQHDVGKTRQRGAEVDIQKQADA
jgi:uncharacterized protein YjbJ (UPF0337 family)